MNVPAVPKSLSASFETLSRFLITFCKLSSSIFNESALGRREMAHRNHASGGRDRVANFRMNFDAGHIFVLDLQSARRFFQTKAGERKRKRGEQDDAASDD